MNKTQPANKELVRALITIMFHNDQKMAQEFLNDIRKKIPDKEIIPSCIEALFISNKGAYLCHKVGVQ